MFRRTYIAGMASATGSASYAKSATSVTGMPTPAYGCAQLRARYDYRYRNACSARLYCCQLQRDEIMGHMLEMGQTLGLYCDAADQRTISGLTATVEWLACGSPTSQPPPHTTGTTPSSRSTFIPRYFRFLRSGDFCHVPAGSNFERRLHRRGRKELATYHLMVEQLSRSLSTKPVRHDGTSRIDKWAIPSRSLDRLDVSSRGCTLVVHSPRSSESAIEAHKWLQDRKGLPPSEAAAW